MADPHEIANVAGTEGLDYIMRLCEDLDMHIYFNLPSCVPAAPLEESGETLEAEDLEPFLIHGAASKRFLAAAVLFLHLLY